MKFIIIKQLSRQPLTLESTNEIKYMAVFKQELLHRFHESSFYHSKSGKRDVRRYTDKYRTLNKETFEPRIFFYKLTLSLYFITL